MSHRRLSGEMSIAGGSFMAVGTILPWFSVNGPLQSVSGNGFDTGSTWLRTSDSWLTAAAPLFVLLGILAIASGIALLTDRGPERALATSNLLIGLLAVVPLVMALVAIQNVLPPVGHVSTSTQFGLWLCAAGGVITLTTGVTQSSARRDRQGRVDPGIP